MERLGKYEIVEKVGVGGFGVVYKGFDPLIKRHVAIKTCSAEDTETRERFRREAEIAGGLQHRNIVTVFEFGFENGVPFLVQEFLPGEDLDRKIKRGEEIPLPEKILWLVQIARGLEFAHRRGIVHRDVKPANIRILEDGTAKLLDFGIARMSQQTSNLTQAGMTLGTAAYLAPEQIRGQTVDSRTDVFSFGVLAYELLAFERPFRAPEIPAIFYKILNEQPAPLAGKVADLPPVLDRIVMRCLEKEPGRRWTPTIDLLRALESLRDPRNRTEPGLARTLVQTSAVTERRPAPARAATRRQLDDVELDLPHRSSPVQSRSMATTAFGAESAGGGWKKWIGFGAAAIALGALALYLGRNGQLPWRSAAETEAASSAAAPAPGTPVGSEPPAVDGPPLPASEAPPPAGQAAGGPAKPPADPSETASTPVAQPAPPPEPEPEPEPEPGKIVIAEGWDPDIRVQVGGRRLRLDRSRSFELPPGSYTVVFSIESGDYSDRAERRVRLGEGATERLSVPLARPGRLTVQPHLGTRPGMVQIDGRMAGPAPLRNRRLPPGEHRLEIFPTSGVTAMPAVTLPVLIASNVETVVTFDLDGQLETQTRDRPIGE
ncbi:MAG TPA: serine/threonine-protein kinase [Thermoanaerobaculia bacterium]|nr:serine/threonine-protein kinase [Thermoanaerobaculia bacterium]